MKRKPAPTLDLDNIVPMLISIWRRLHKESGPADVLQTREFRRTVEAIKILNAHSFEGKSLIGQDYFKKPDLLGAYLLYHWVIHYQEGLSLLGELPVTPSRVLDVCSGPAPFSFAALKHGASEVFAVDMSQAALQLGAEVCGRYGFPLTIRKWDCLKESALPVEGKFDLIILGHCLTELFPENQKNWIELQFEFINRLLSKLNPTGHLLIVDNSFIQANKRILQLRERLVNAGIAVQAPCIWQGECPALKSTNSPCYAQRALEKPYLIKEFQRAAQINLSSLKMSYLLMKAPGAAWPELPIESAYRVISPPVDSFQGKRYYLCGKDGKKSLGSRLTTLSKETRAFEFLKRGEVISIENSLESKQAMDIIEGTTMKVIAACGKPLPDSIYD